jgi:hypothetical protein
MMKYIVVMVLLGILGCGKSRRAWDVPKNEQQIIKSVIPFESINAWARVGPKGAIRLKIAVPTRELDPLIASLMKRYKLQNYQSSKLVANNHASSQSVGTMNVVGEWIPTGFSLVDGYTGDGVSLARYDRKRYGETILILYARSENLLSLK